MPKQPGDVALAGTLNAWGVLDGHVVAAGERKRAAKNRQPDRAGAAFESAIAALQRSLRHRLHLFGSLSASAGVFSCRLARFSIGRHSSAHAGRTSAFYRAMTLLVVMSPCALVLSVPSAIFSAIACGARRGVLFRGGAAIETLADVRTVALDKTGTLTHGVPAFGPHRNVQAATEDTIVARSLQSGAAFESSALARDRENRHATRSRRRSNSRMRNRSPAAESWRAIEGLLYALGSRDFVRATIAEPPCEAVARSTNMMSPKSGSRGPGHLRAIPFAR